MKSVFHPFRKKAAVLFARRSCCCAAAIAMALVPIVSSLPADEGKPVFGMRLYDKEETFTYNNKSYTPNRTATAEETAAIERAIGYVNEVFADNSPVRTSTLGVFYLEDGAKTSAGNPTNNAYSLSSYWKMPGDRYWRSETEILTVLGEEIAPSGGLDGILCLEPTATTNWSTLSNSSVPSGNWSTEAILIHELGHSLGMRTYYSVIDKEQGLYRWGSPTFFQSQAVDADGNVVEIGDEFYARTDNFTYFFAGDHAQTLFGDKIPLTIRSEQKSHLGLDPLLMTHESFRNYTFYTELELAVFQDLGYEIDRSRFFGKSYYVADGTAESPAENHIGFDSSATYAVGLHVFSDDNYLIQTANLNASGAGGCCLRIDGEDNVVTIAENVSVAANGLNGIGLLVSNGAGNTVNLIGNVRAADATGCGVYLGYGHNLLLNERSSPLDKPLVDALNVSGSIDSGGDAIDVGANTQIISGTETIRPAVVDEINILSGATISGDIIADGVLYNLSFGRQTNADGSAGNEPDETFSFAYDGDILTKAFTLGQTQIGTQITLFGGETTLSGTVSALRMSVDKSATLAGTGTYRLIEGTVNHGTLSPGNSNDRIDTMTFQGALTNTESSVLAIDLTASCAPVAGVDIDSIAVAESSAERGDGDAQLNGGTIKVNAASGRYQTGTRYRFLAANDSLTASDVKTIEANKQPLFHFEFGNDERSAWLTSTRDYRYTSSADTPNQSAIAEWIDRVGTDPAPGSDLYDMLVALDAMNDKGCVSAKARYALDQISGALYGTLDTAQIDHITTVNSTLMNLLRGGTMSNGGEGYSFSRNRMRREKKRRIGRYYWGTFLGAEGRIDSDQNAFGANDSLYGVIFGFDQVYSTDTRAGFFGSCGNATLRSTSLSEKIEADELLFGGYIRQEMNVGYLLGTAALGVNVSDAERNLTLFGRRAESSHSALASLAYLERGIEFESNGRKLLPYFGLQYAGVYRESFNETGAGALNLSTRSNGADSLRTSLGIRACVVKTRVNGDRIQLSLQASWLRELLDANGFVTARLSDPDRTNPLANSLFAVRGVKMGRDWAFLGTGLRSDRGALRLFAGYDLGLNALETLHTGSAGFSWRR